MCDGDSEIGAGEVRQDREVHSDDLSAGIEYRTTRPSMSCLCVIDQAIGANNAKVPLRHQGSDQLSSTKLLHETLRIVPGCLCDLFERTLVYTCKDPFDSGGISNQDDRAT